MKKRIAYIGLSYPLLFDYKNMAKKTKNDTWDSPNPIIETPMGLMILYDELWFLCESLCPNNMRKLPYVKFVDKMFPNFDFNYAISFSCNNNMNLKYNNLSYSEILTRMNLEKWTHLDGHSHGLIIGTERISANSSNTKNFIFDLCIFEELKKYQSTIEFVTNSKYRYQADINSNADAEITEQLVINKIPNYLGINGPYHECMEELRENQYLRDFREWIINQHNHIQTNEIDEIKIIVEKTIEETKNIIFKKYLDENSKYSFCVSTGKTVLATGGGLICPAISVGDAIHTIKTNKENMLDAKSYRWQGFVLDAQNISKSNKL